MYREVLGCKPGTFSCAFGIAECFVTAMPLLAQVYLFFNCENKRDKCDARVLSITAVIWNKMDSFVSKKDEILWYLETS